MISRPPAPPMGWNSFDCYGHSVDETQFCKNADILSERFREFGYEYCVLDFCWFYPEKGTVAPPNQRWNGSEPDVRICMDEFGRPLPAPEKFPSCNRSLRPLADYVHSKGLKFGVHFMRGVPREAVIGKVAIKNSPYTAADIVSGEDCDWLNVNAGIDVDKPGGREYIRSMAELIDEWQIDFVKLDDALRPYRKKETECWSEELDRLDRETVLSLSPGEAPLSEADSLSGAATMWRVMDDLWDRAEDLSKITALAEKWNTCSRRGAYPDLDMLPFGRLLYCDRDGGRRTRLTPHMEKYMITLWAIAGSPIMIGSELSALSSRETALLTHPAILDLCRSRLYSRHVPSSSKLSEWVAETATTVYLAAFNPDRRLFHKYKFSGARNRSEYIDAFTGKRIKEGSVFLLPPLSSVLIAAEKDQSVP